MAPRALYSWSTQVEGTQQRVSSPNLYFTDEYIDAGAERQQKTHRCLGWKVVSKVGPVGFPTPYLSIT